MYNMELFLYIKLEKMCSYFSKNFIINPGVSFSESLFSVVRTHLCLKYTLCLELDVLGVTAGLIFFPPFSFFCVLCAHPQTSVWVYIHASVHTQNHMWISTQGRVG